MMIFHFDSLPISDNQLYGNIPGQARRFLSAKGKTYKQDVEAAVNEQIRHQDRTIGRKDTKYTDQILDLTDKELIVSIILCGSWYTQSDSIRKKDCQNYSKALLDSIWTSFKLINPSLDDSQIWLLSIAKIDSEENGNKEYTEIQIKALYNEDDEDDGHDGQDEDNLKDIED